MTRVEHHALLPALLAALLLAAGAAGDTITLRGAVRLDAGQREVRLANIAELAGPDAERHADLLVETLETGDRPREITLAQVRRLLTEAGIHWGKVQLAGERVIVRPAAPGMAGPPLAMSALAIDSASRAPSKRAAPRREATPAAALIEASTLRGAVCRRIVKGMGRTPDDLKLLFEDRDKEFLESPLDQHRFEMQPLSSFSSDRIDLRIRTWEGGRITDSRSITVRPLVRAETVILARDVNRNEELHEADLRAETRWLSTSQAEAMSTLVGAVGRIAAGRLKSGNVLKVSDLRRDMVIERGDRVMVRCLVGGAVIALEAEARADAAEGDTVELRKLGERETFFAVATGPGAAIVDLGR
jgi:flagella basal body P-ring formation protein FlgA